MSANQELGSTMNKQQTSSKKRYRKNEILIQCHSCQRERLLAYWDPELEHYIYLADEPALCQNCCKA